MTLESVFWDWMCRQQFAHAHHPGVTTGGRQHRQRLIAEHHQSDAVILRHHMLRQPRRGVHIVPEPIQLAALNAAAAPDIQRHDHIQVLIFGEIPAHQLSAPCGRAPVDDPQRIAGSIVAQLLDLRAGADDTTDPRRPPAPRPTALSCRLSMAGTTVELLGALKLQRPPRQTQRPGEPRRLRWPADLAQAA